jgi:4,5-DOPA dioxygenase extradiol
MSIILFLLILILTFIGYKYYFGGKIEYYDSSSTKILPSFFISHSNPSLPLEKDFKLYKFLHNFQKDQLRGYAKPKGIVVVSAHAVAYPHKISLTPKQLFDFTAGKDAPTLKLKYRPRGDEHLSSRVAELLRERKIDCMIDTKLGMDHGTWVPLSIMFPRADIPVVIVTLHPALDAQYHVTLGQALAPLRREGVLIIGSGQATFNQGLEGSYLFEDKPAAWSVAFDDWLTRVITSVTGEERRHELVNFHRNEISSRAHPPGQTEHLIPIMVNLGTLSSETATVSKVHGSYQGNFSVSCFAFH